MNLITEREVEENFDMKTAIEAMKDAFEEYYRGKAGADPRQRTFSETSVLSTMPAFMDKYHIAGMKTYIATREGARFVVLLFDSASAELIAVIEANRMGQVRTGAVTALATSILHQDCSVFTLVGTGFQAETQLEGILSVTGPQEVRVFSRTASHGREFVERMSKKFGRDIEYYDDINRALKGADLISSITSSQEPVIRDLSFLDSFHLNIAGANILNRREVSDQVIRSGDLVAVEHLEQAFRESSEISDFVNGGGKPVEFKDVVGQINKFRGFKRTIFKTMGIGLEDIVSGYYILKKMNLV
ncbi:MAG: ornithine cyclodeaminase [Candidatus Thermoplasmatota archaeon]|nr:ornithine cyclodeaminase [Candidatus Thermoplasmatota archaeon]